MRIETIGNKLICLGGLGKFYYESGLPIDIQIDLLKEKYPNIEISHLHLARELMRNGWPDKRIVNTIEVVLCTDKAKQVETFCALEWEDQNEMIFDYLLFDGDKYDNSSINQVFENVMNK